MPIPSDLSKTTDPHQYEMASAVTLSDTGSIPLTSALWITHNNSGSIKVRMCNGDDVTFTWSGTAFNQLLPIRCNRVYVTGTTASLVVVALY